MSRFHWRRKRAALALLPVAGMLFTTGGLAAAQTAPAPAPEDGTEAATSGGRAESKVRLRVKRHVMAGDSVKMRGRAGPGGRRWVTLTIGGRKVRSVRTRRDGTFRLRWRAPSTGIFQAKAVARGTEHAKRARSRSQTIHSYRSSHASYFGPGLYGGRTACGKTLTPSIIGVANKSLPCGTKVVFRYRGRTARARVIDRGPYAAGREWDLTAALKAKLGFGSTGMVLSTK